MLLSMWQHLLEHASVPRARTLALDLAELASLLHAGRADEVPFQLALIGAQVHRVLPHLPEGVHPSLLNLAAHLTRLARVGSVPHSIL